MSIWSIHRNAAYQMPADIRQSQPGRVQSEPVKEAPKDSAANAPPRESQDRYDRNVPAGEPAEGLYSVERNKDGAARIEYAGPRAKEAEPQEGMTREEAASTGDADKNAATHSKGSVNAKSSKVLRTAHTAREVQRLKVRMHRLQRQANAEPDLGKRASLQSKVQQLSVEIAWKESEGYRRERAVAS